VTTFYETIGLVSFDEEIDLWELKFSGRREKDEIDHEEVDGRNLDWLFCHLLHVGGGPDQSYGLCNSQGCF
jgi:hypothetical protein